MLYHCNASNSYRFEFNLSNLICKAFAYYSFNEYEIDSIEGTLGSIISNTSSLNNHDAISMHSVKSGDQNEYKDHNIESLFKDMLVDTSVWNRSISQHIKSKSSSVSKLSYEGVGYSIGYCQGMNFVVGFLILGMEMSFTFLFH